MIKSGVCDFWLGRFFEDIGNSFLSRGDIFEIEIDLFEDVTTAFLISFARF